MDLIAAEYEESTFKGQVQTYSIQDGCVSYFMKNPDFPIAGGAGSISGYCEQLKAATAYPQKKRGIQ